MTNFAQPVSMECTEEQYNRDLKYGLEKLGYKMNVVWGNNMFYIGTNFDYQNYIGGTIPYSSIYERNRHFTDHYNPELFLAIAGMREGEDVHAGEWVICINDLDGYFTKDKLYENVEIDKRWLGFVNDKEHLHSWSTRELKDYFRKATLSELITHFTKKDMPKEHGIEESILQIIKEESERSDVRKYTCVNGFGYSKYERNIAERVASLFNGSMEHEFKFGDKVLCWDSKEAREDKGSIFISKVDSEYPFIVVDLDDFIPFKNGAPIWLKPFKYCIPFKQPLKITRSEIAEWKGTDHFEIVD